MLNPLHLKILNNFFFIFSESGPDMFSKQLKPSSLYKPLFCLPIYHARMSLLFDKDNVWVKKDNPEFDVTMDSYDGAELCELIGLYLLHLLTKEFGYKYK